MPRLLVVSRQFWPVCNEASYRLGDLVVTLRDAGIDVRVLTTRWHSRWPAQTRFQNIYVDRLLPAPVTPWSDGFFVRNIWQWLEKFGQDFDAIYLDSFDLLGNQRLSNSLREKRWLIRCNAASGESIRGAAASKAFEAIRRGGRLSVLAPSAVEHRAAISSGLEPTHVERCEDVALRWFSRSAATRQAAAEALLRVSSDFYIPPSLPLVIAFFENRQVQQESEMVQELITQIGEPPKFRGWIFGSGDSVRRHYNVIKDFGLHHDLLLHSSFDDIENVVQAADFAICPAPGVGSSYFYPIALASGLPAACGQNTSQALSWQQSRMHQLEQMTKFLSNPAGVLHATERSERFRTRLQNKDIYIQTWTNLLGETN